MHKFHEKNKYFGNNFPSNNFSKKANKYNSYIFIKPIKSILFSIKRNIKQLFKRSSHLSEKERERERAF